MSSDRYTKKKFKIFDDECLSVIRSPKTPKSLRVLQSLIRKEGYDILIMVTTGGQQQLETVDLSISNILE